MSWRARHRVNKKIQGTDENTDPGFERSGPMMLRVYLGGAHLQGPHAVSLTCFSLPVLEEEHVFLTLAFCITLGQAAPSMLWRGRPGTGLPSRISTADDALDAV